MELTTARSILTAVLAILSGIDSETREALTAEENVLLEDGFRSLDKLRYVLDQRLNHHTGRYS